MARLAALGVGGRAVPNAADVHAPSPPTLLAGPPAARKERCGGKEGTAPAGAAVPGVSASNGGDPMGVIQFYQGVCLQKGEPGGGRPRGRRLRGVRTCYKYRLLGVGAMMFGLWGADEGDGTTALCVHPCNAPSTKQALDYPDAAPHREPQHTPRSLQTGTNPHARKPLTP